MPSNELDQGSDQASRSPATGTGSKEGQEHLQEQAPQGSEEGRTPGQESQAGPDAQQDAPKIVWPDLMLDLEYLAGSTNAVVVQIGAMPFDITTGEYARGLFFSSNLDIDQQLKAGRKIDRRTLQWWFGQALEKRGVPPWFENQEEVVTALSRLDQFIATHTKQREVRCWSHINCDPTKIQDLCTQFGIRFPLMWKNAQHIHTLVLMSGVKKPPHTSADHEAVSDCVRQIIYCSTAWQLLRSK